MPRRPRSATSGLVFHVVNRGAKRSQLFDDAEDYEAFEEILVDGLSRIQIALFAYCLMPNHWHLVLSPKADGALSRFMHWVTTTHARRWQTRHIDGQGAVYQGRFRAVPISCDGHFLWVCRYVERNALRASLVNRAEKWRWSSLGRSHVHGDASWLTEWPISRPVDWTDLVNRPQAATEVDGFRRAVRTGEPYGHEAWRAAIRAQLGLKPRRPCGRPPRRRGGVLKK
jgi:putative transposase